ncbi:MAG: twin-arginine translocase subunit TatC [Nitriliruptoraceae bacterium]
MPLVEHLRELRTRLFRAVVALAIGTAVGYAVFPFVLDLLIEPYCEVLDGGDNCSLIALRPLEPFSVRIRASLVIGLFLGGPVIFYQLWRFVTPGLTRRERRFTLPFVVLSQVMFAAGILLAYLIIPQALTVLLAMGGPRIEAFLSATEYLSFFLRMCLAFAMVLELPLVLAALVLVGVLDHSSLKRGRPYAVVAMVTLAALVTPTTDAVTLLAVSAPMLLFYEATIIFAWFVARRRDRRQP